MRWMRVLVVAACALAVAPLADAQPRGPIVHEPIPPDPQEDLTLDVSLDGELPAAIQTKDGVVTAPDPRRPISANETPPASQKDGPNATFRPDRNTRRPDVQGYDEPFTPSTAPFKRLEAFDSVTDTYELYVRDKRLTPLAPGAQPAPDGSEDQFFADMVVDLAPGKPARIASVGPGARIVRARLGIGQEDIQFKITKDGAENWFLEASGAVTARARLVMELTIPRGAFGGDFADASWSDLPRVPPLPPNVAASAHEVTTVLGISQAQRPRDIVQRLVTYFRSFVDSEDPPRGRGDIYLDLALSKKGVCRHRAFAFMITAESLGIPTRMILNEAHAWVEVHDGTLWRRIDLGGAGRMVNPASNALPERNVHQPPPDAFQWPQGSERGEDMVEQARERARRELSSQSGGSSSGTQQGRGDGGSPAPSGSGANNGELPGPNGSGAPMGSGSANGSGAPNGFGDQKDERPFSTISVAVPDPNAHRGAPLQVRGSVRAESEPCAHVIVELYLRDAKSGKQLFLGATATGDQGDYGASIVVPGNFPLGDYDLVAKTPGDARCGGGGSY